MRKTLALMVLWLFCALRAQAYSIEGLWRLTDIQQSRLPDTSMLKMEVRDFVYRNSTIRWALTLEGCQYLKAMIDIQANSIFVDTSTLYLDNDRTKNCSASLLLPDQRFQNLLRKTFTFQIISNFMIFSDPEGQVLFKFQRLTSNDSRVNLKGAWMASIPANAESAQMLEISDTEVVFCQRLTKIGYSLPPGNKIEFANISENAPACRGNILVNLFRNSLYFAKRNNTVELYNQKDELKLTLVYVMDLESAQKLRDQQKEDKENAISKLPEPPRAPQGPPLSAPPQIGPLAGPSITEFIGKWSIQKVFQGPSIVASMVLIITKDTILITGDCNTYTFVYSVASTNPIRVKRQSFRQTQNSCTSEDEQIYKTGLTKVVFFKPETSADKSILKLQDDKGQQLFALSRPLQTRIIPNVVAPQPQIPSPVFSLPSPGVAAPIQKAASASMVPDGKYMILLLMRRDLPRKILSINSNSFSLKICNEIRGVISTEGEKMTIKTEVKGSGSCDTAQENLIISNLGKVKSFAKDELDLILKDQDDKEIVSLNFLG